MVSTLGPVNGLWVDGWEHAPYPGLGGGTFTDLDNPKILWHTWEGDNWASAESAGGWAHYPPHAGVHRGDRKVRQYVPLDRSAYALANSASEHEYLIQIEMNGFARETQDWPDDDIDWLRSAVLEPIEALIPVPRVVIPVGFHGEGEGMILASSRSPIRLASVDDLRAFSGHLAHQNAPAPDAHWDAGRFRIDYLLSQPPPPPPVILEEPVTVSFVARQGKAEVYLIGIDAEPRHVTSFAKANYIVDVLGARVSEPSGPSTKPREDGEKTTQMVWELDNEAADFLKVPA